jgi:hypothetical protein
MMIIMSLPEFCIFCVGVYSLYSTNLLYEEMQARGIESKLDALPFGKRSTTFKKI